MTRNKPDTRHTNAQWVVVVQDLGGDYHQTDIGPVCLSSALQLIEDVDELIKAKGPDAKSYPWESCKIFLAHMRSGEVVHDDGFCLCDVDEQVREAVMIEAETVYGHGDVDVD